MEAYIQDAPCLYFTTTDEGTIEAVNDTLCHQVGYTRAELLGQKQDLIFTVPTRIFQQTHFFPLLKMQGHAEEIYITLLTKEGEWLPVLISARRKKAGEKYLSMYAGIVVHNRKKFEDELVAAKRAAEAALHENTALQQAKQELQEHTELLDQQMYLVNKQNEELRQFNHVVTHEMQEPLRKLFLFTNMLLEGSHVGSVENTVQKIRSVSEQMKAKLSGLQQYVWLIETPIRMTSLSLHGMFTAAVAQLQKEHPDVSIHLRIDDLPEVYADKGQMELLINEITANAVRFRKHPNAVTVFVSASIIQENRFRTIADKYAYTDYVRIQVRDDGQGFDATYKDQVFALFRRLHTTGGRGIGLSLCKKVVENHQGTITIDSRIGEGTLLTLTLPYITQPAATERGEKEPLKTSS
ncbi:MAG: ATP-binding protein [Bacteroidota bacterium]|nr:ATP-binding protein [Bacteroidota bacterium]